MPFVGHKAQLVEGEWPPAEESSRVRGKIKVEWDAGEMLSDYEGVAPYRPLELVISSEKSIWLPKLVALEDSVLGVLLKLAQRISERFPWWRVRNIPELVLRGRAPMVGLPFEWFYQPGLTHSEPEYNRRRSRIYQSITLEVPPWFSVENVSEVYKSVKELIPTTAQPSPRRLALFEFVMKHPEVTVPGEGQIPKVPSWAQLLRAWNETLPAGHEWRYKDRRNFWRDFSDAYKQIVNYYR